jgi:hypothetical protein
VEKTSGANTKSQKLSPQSAIQAEQILAFCVAVAS